MTKWYYVAGSERVGPVEELVLKNLFSKKEILLETYIWRKGFENWERLKDVKELLFQEESFVVPPAVAKAVPAKVEKKLEEVVKETSSPEVTFRFNWSSVKENDELFFVKIGKDRKNFSGSEIFGPYSLVELKEALSEKRMNFQTQVFSPGMGSWMSIQETPLNSHYKAGATNRMSLKETPLVVVFDYFPIPLVTVVKKAGVKEGILVGAGPFGEFQDKTVKASLYVGSEIKVKNVKVKISRYEKKDQVINCHFVDLDQEAKRIMLNHAV